MTSFETLLAKLAGALDENGVGYMIIGGQAVLIHGEPRQTQDIDVTLAVDHDQAAKIIRTLKSAGLEPIAPDPVAFARETNVLPMKDESTGLRVDIIFSDLPYEQDAIKRAVAVPVAGRSVRFASAEDLVIQKLIAGRPTDLQDVRGVWLRKGKALDTGYIDLWLVQFARLPGLEGVLDSWRTARL